MIKALRSLLAKNRKPDLQIKIGEILPAETFKRLLERERALADRSGESFSLLAISIEPAPARVEDLAALVEMLGREVRVSDEIGWFEEDKIGVILPQTPPSGARILAERLKRDISSILSGFDYSIYTYPTASHSRTSAQDRAPADPSSKRKVHPAEVATFPPPAPANGSGDSAGWDERALAAYLAPPLPWWKRVIDVAGAGIGLILAAPLFLVIALLIKIVSPGPVFFRQERIGFLGKPFKIWKFRTMHVDSDTGLHQKHFSQLMRNGQAMTKLDSSKDPRIIPMGGFLRTTALDELPQLINVLRGEMSLVGPRPCIPYEAEGYEAWQKRRFDTSPGLTGLWQVSGKNRTTFRQMIQLDLRYLGGRTLREDIRIVLRTIPAILEQRRGRKAGKAKPQSKGDSARTGSSAHHPPSAVESAAK